MAMVPVPIEEADPTDHAAGFPQPNAPGHFGLLAVAISLLLDEPPRILERGVRRRVVHLNLLVTAECEDVGSVLRIQFAEIDPWCAQGRKLTKIEEMWNAQPPGVCGPCTES